MFPREDIIACAKDIQSALPDLVGDEASNITQKLSALLERHIAGDDVEREILQVFRRYKLSRAWAMRYLTGSPNGDIDEITRGYQPPPPGAASPIPGTSRRYFCRICGYSQLWVRREAGQQPPNCPNDAAVILQLSRTHAEDSNDK